MTEKATQTKKAQRDLDAILRRRLVAAMVEEFRFGALSDSDYGHDPEKLEDLHWAEGRGEEARGWAEDLGLEPPDRDEVRAEAMRALREECEKALREHEALVADLRARGSGEEEGLNRDLAVRLNESEARDDAMVVRYLDDIEEDDRWRLAHALGLAGETADALRAAGLPEEAVDRFVRAGLDVDGGEELVKAAECHRIDPDGLRAYLMERAKRSETSQLRERRIRS